MAVDTIATQTYTYRDVRGHTGRIKLFMAYDSSVAQDAKTLGGAIRSAIAPLTNAVLVKGSGPDGLVLDPVTFGTAAAYANAETKQVLTYFCGTAGPPTESTKHTLAIPAPKIANFNADMETGLASALNALVTVLKTASGAAYVCNADGQPVIHGLGSVLSRRKLQRKLTIYDKLPDLSAFEL